MMPIQKMASSSGMKQKFEIVARAYFSDMIFACG
jgi:hypothetical protein